MVQTQQLDLPEVIAKYGPMQSSVEANKSKLASPEKCRCRETGRWHLGDSGRKLGVFVVTIMVINGDS